MYAECQHAADAETHHLAEELTWHSLHLHRCGYLAHFGSLRLFPSQVHAAGEQVLAVMMYSQFQLWVQRRKVK